MPHSPQPVFNVKLRKYNAGESTYREVPLFGSLLTEFEWYVYSGFTASRLVITLVDPTWELGNELDLYQFKKGDRLDIVFQFGYSSPYWSNLEGDSEDSMSPEFIATASLFKPEFTDENIQLRIEAYNLELAKVLEVLNRPYTIPSSITNLRDAYLNISETFGIPITSPAGTSLSDIDETEFSDQNKQLKLPAKKSQQTGLDYIKRLFITHPVTISGTSTDVRFNPYSNNGIGSYEIRPSNEGVKIKRIYRWNGDDSRIVRFSPSINPFTMDKNTESIQYSTVNSQEKERKYKSDESLGSNDVLKKVIPERSEPVLENLSKRAESSKIEDIVLGEIVILSDPNLLVGDHVQVEVYNKLNGGLVLSVVCLVTNVRHYLEEGRIYTEIKFSRSDIEPILSSILNKDLNVKVLNDILQESEYKELVNLYAGIKGFLSGFGVA